jgi:cytosine/adenosine deaminase-related metal-dependent hydrolase
VPTGSPWSAIAYAAQACDVRHVTVDGKLVVLDRTLQTLDVGVVRDRARAAALRLFP